MPFWQGAGGEVSQFNLERVGPFCDVVCGTEGRSTDLNQLVADGHKRIILTSGAILTADLTLSASNGFIVSLGASRHINLGAFTLFVNNTEWHLEGFVIDGPSGSCLLVGATAGGLSVNRCTFKSSSTAHGVHLVGGTNYHFSGVRCWDNALDGMRMEAACANHVVWGSYLSFNTGYGLNDLSDDCIVGLCRIEGNTAGGINGTPAAEGVNLEQP